MVSTKHPLDQLIEGVKRANDWSDPDLVNNAKERHHVLSKSNISRMRGQLVSVKAEVIFALAAGLRVTPAQVAIAAIESMGIPLPEHELPTPEQSIRLDTSLSDKDKTLLFAVLEQIRKESRASGEAGEAEEASADKPKRDGLARLAVHQEAAKSVRRNRRVQNPDDTHQEGG